MKMTRTYKENVKRSIKENLVGIVTVGAFIGSLALGAIVNQRKTEAEGGVYLSNDLGDMREVYDTNHDGVADTVYQWVMASPRGGLACYQRAPTDEETKTYRELILRGEHALKR